MNTLRIMPVGDSITRGSYLACYQEGPYAGEPIGLPHPQGGGWRALLQDRLRQAGVPYTFCGDLSYGAQGSKDGQLTPGFAPRHHGLAGFGNQGILTGGMVPTPRDVLDTLGLTAYVVREIVAALDDSQPTVVLLMSGSNGFDAPTRDVLIRTILDHLNGHLFVATIPPQCPPREGWEQVAAYNASLPSVVKELQTAGESITLVDIHALLDTETDLLPDGVHPNTEGMRKIAEGWYAALMQVWDTTNTQGER